MPWCAVGDENYGEGSLARARRHGAPVPQRRGDLRPQLRPHPRDQPQEAGPAPAHLRRPGHLRPDRRGRPHLGARPGRPRAGRHRAVPHHTSPTARRSTSSAPTRSAPSRSSGSRPAARSTSSGPQDGRATDAWDPGQYGRFQAERDQPFHDLLGARAAVERPSSSTSAAATDGSPRSPTTQLGAANTSGSTPRRDARQGRRRLDLDFEVGTSRPGRRRRLDVVLANASLHWVPGHADVLARWAGSLGGGGQLGVQVPANARPPVAHARRRGGRRARHRRAARPGGHQRARAGEYADAPRPARRPRAVRRACRSTSTSWRRRPRSSSG